MSSDKIKFNCLLSQEMWNRIEKYTDANGVTKTSLVIAAINEYLFDSSSDARKALNEINVLKNDLKKTNDKLDVIMALLAKK